MPFKEEDISINPSIKLYHDIIYDKEIELITKMASIDVSKLLDAHYVPRYHVFRDAFNNYNLIILFLNIF